MLLNFVLTIEAGLESPVGYYVSVYLLWAVCEELS